MRLLAVFLAVAGSLCLVGRVQAAWPSTRLTPKNINDQPRSFAIKVERVNDKDKGEYLRFLVTVKAKDGGLPLLPRRETELAIFDGKVFVSSSAVQVAERGGGELSYSFEVAAKYVESSRFYFHELAGAPGDPGSGRTCWFDLKDFAQPAPQPPGRGEKDEKPELLSPELRFKLMQLGQLRGEIERLARTAR